MVVIDVIFEDLFVIGMFGKNKINFFYIKLFVYFLFIFLFVILYCNWLYFNVL